MTGTPCTRCRDGYLVVYSTITSGNVRTRYFHCWACSNTPDENKVVTRLSGNPDCPRTRRRRRIKS